MHFHSCMKLTILLQPATYHCCINCKLHGSIARTNIINYHQRKISVSTYQQLYRWFHAWLIPHLAILCTRTVFIRYRYTVYLKSCLYKTLYYVNPCDFTQCSIAIFFSENLLSFYLQLLFVLFHR